MSWGFWGVFAEFLAVAAAAVAVIFAYRAWKVSRETLSLEHTREEKSRWRAAQEQARGVSAWWVGTGPPEKLLGIMLVNSSDAPVYDVEFRVQYDPGSAESGVSMTGDVATLPPGRYIKFFTSDGHRKLHGNARAGERVSRQEAWQFLRAAENCDSVDVRADARKYVIESLSFLDAGNLRWRRDRRGRLEPECHGCVDGHDHPEHGEQPAAG